MRTTLIQAREQSSQQHGNGNFTSIIKGNKVSLVEGDSVVLDSAFLDTRTKTADRINVEEDLTLKFNVIQYAMNSNWRFKSYFGINNGDTPRVVSPAIDNPNISEGSLLNTMKPAYLGKWSASSEWINETKEGKKLTIPQVVSSIIFTTTREIGDAFNLQLRYSGLNGENQYHTISIPRTINGSYTHTFKSITDRRYDGNTNTQINQVKEQVLISRSAFEVVEPPRMISKGWNINFTTIQEELPTPPDWSPTLAGSFALEPAHINTQIIIPAGIYTPTFLASYITTQMNKRYNSNFCEPQIRGAEALGSNPNIEYFAPEGGDYYIDAEDSMGSFYSRGVESTLPNIHKYNFNTDPGIFGKQVFSYQTPDGELVRYDCSGYVGSPFCCSDNGLEQEKQPSKDLGRAYNGPGDPDVIVGRGNPLTPYFFQGQVGDDKFDANSWVADQYIIKPDTLAGGGGNPPDPPAIHGAGRTDSTYGQPIEAYPNIGGGNSVSGYRPKTQGRGENVFAFKCMDEYTPILTEETTGGNQHGEPFAFKYVGLMEWGDGSTGQPGNSTAQIIGASQVSLEYADGFKWTYLHTPLYGGPTGTDIVTSSIPACYLDQIGQAYPQSINNTPNELNNSENFHSSNGGIFFSCLEPASFWEDTLGFNLEQLNLSMTIANPIKFGYRECKGQKTASTNSITNSQINQGGSVASIQYLALSNNSTKNNACFHQHALAGSTAIGGAININVIAPDITMKRCRVGQKWTRGIIETSTNTIDVGALTSQSILAMPLPAGSVGVLNGNKIIPYPNSLLGALNHSFTSVVIQSATEEIVAGNSQLHSNNEGYFLIEINAKMNNSFTGSSFNSNLIMGIVDKYYTTGNYTSATGGNIEYTHYGEPVYLSEIGVRILNPDGSLGDLGSDNSIFLKVNKQIAMPQKNTGKK